MPAPIPSLDWGDLFARYETMAVSFARGLVGDQELARDLFQESARATWERSTTGAVQFSSDAHVRNYLFQVMRNLAADVRAGRRRAPQDLTHDPVDTKAGSAIALLASRETAELRTEAMRRAFQQLPLREQEVLSLRYVRGMTYNEIARTTGKSISTLQARTEAGLARLRQMIGKTSAPE